MEPLTFKVYGKYALFSDPVTRVGGEKSSYPVPTYEALKGIVSSIYWKPTFIWFIDKVRIMKPIHTVSKGIRTLMYHDNKTDLSCYSYLADCEYQVQAHFEWNMNRPEFAADRIEKKHLDIARRMLFYGGRRDIFLGARECQAYVEPCEFGSGVGHYDNLNEFPFGVMLHGFTYADEAYSEETKNKLTVRFWNPVMRYGVIDFIRPDQCSYRMCKFVRNMVIKRFPVTNDKGGGLMGLLQRAYETYRNLEGYIGVPSKDNFSMLAPVYHIYRNTTAVIKISMDGKFVGIDWFQKEIHGKLKDAPEKIIVPVCSLTNNAKAWSPYVLCADYAVISGDVGLVADYDGRDEKKKKKVAEDRDFIRQKHDYYVSNLKDWAESEFTHPIVQAVYKYVSGGTLVDDVKSRSDKKVLKAKDAVAWRVLGIESGSTSFCYQNKDLFVAHIRRMRKLLAIESDTADELVNEDGSNLDSVLKKIDLKLTYGQGLCFVTGGVVPMMLKHPQGPIPVFSSSKLLSSSDDQNFVYRGRFKNATQAFGVSCEVSWAAHNVLTWLADNGGVMVYNAEVPDKPNRSFFGNRVFLCWSPSGKPVPTVMNNKFDTGFKDMEKPKFSLVKYRNASDYLKNKLSRLGKVFDLHDVVVVASFTAATNGRLSLTSYHEIDANAYFKLFEDWYSSMSFFECKNGYYVYFVPSVFVICLYMFGVVKSTDKNIGYLELPKKTDGKSNGVLGAFGEMFELVNNSMINQAPLNAVVVNTLVDRASRLYLIKSLNIRERLLSVACAVVRKYSNDRLKKEVYSVMLDPDLKDRSYQFGRLLAVFEKVERDTFDANESREPNAMRFQAYYRARPFSTANQIHDQLASYFAKLNKLNPGWCVFYKRLIAEILEKISEFPEKDLNRPLGDTYLLGYYLQRKDLYTSKKNDENPNGKN